MSDADGIVTFGNSRKSLSEAVRSGLIRLDAQRENKNIHISVVTSSDQPVQVRILKPIGLSAEQSEPKNIDPALWKLAQKAFDQAHPTSDEGAQRILWQPQVELVTKIFPHETASPALPEALRERLLKNAALLSRIGYSVQRPEEAEQKLEEFKKSQRLPKKKVFDLETEDSIEVSAIEAERKPNPPKKAVKANSGWLLNDEFWKYDPNQFRMSATTSGTAAEVEAERLHRDAIINASHSPQASRVVFATSLSSTVTTPGLRLIGQNGKYLKFDDLKRSPSGYDVVVSRSPAERLDPTRSAEWSTTRDRIAAHCPSCRIWLDDPTPDITAQLARFPKSVAVGQVEVYVPQESDPFTNNRGAHLVSKLRDVTVAARSERRTQPTTVVAVSGHRDASLHSYLDQLGERGAFVGRVVLLYACHGNDSQKEQSELIKRHGAIAVLTFPTEISADAVQRTLKSMTTILSSGPKDLYELPRAAVRAALQELERERDTSQSPAAAQ